MKFGLKQRQRLSQVTHWRGDYPGLLPNSSSCGHWQCLGPEAPPGGGEVLSRVFGLPLSKIVHAIYSDDEAITSHVSFPRDGETEKEAAKRF